MAEFCSNFSCDIGDLTCPNDAECPDCSYYSDCGACEYALECPHSPYGDNIVNMGGVFDADYI